MPLSHYDSIRVATILKKVTEKTVTYSHFDNGSLGYYIQGAARANDSILVKALLEEAKKHDFFDRALHIALRSAAEAGKQPLFFELFALYPKEKFDACLSCCCYIPTTKEILDEAIELTRQHNHVEFSQNLLANKELYLNPTLPHMSDMTCHFLLSCLAFGAGGACMGAFFSCWGPGCWSVHTAVGAGYGAAAGGAIGACNTLGQYRRVGGFFHEPKPSSNPGYVLMGPDDEQKNAPPHSEMSL